jgi:hypothetical protein
MDHQWTTGTESAVLDREIVAEGKGSVSFHDTEANGVVWQARASPRLAGSESHGPRERSPVFKTSDLPQLTTLHNS